MDASNGWTLYQFPAQGLTVELVQYRFTLPYNCIRSGQTRGDNVLNEITSDRFNLQPCFHTFMNRKDVFYAIIITVELNLWIIWKDSSQIIISL